MAHKPTSFKIDKKKNAIIIYTNVEAGAEKTLIDFYLNKGLIPMFQEKKPSKTVAEMRKELSKDEETLKKFNEAYKDKEKGFFKACKIYSTWLKDNKAEENTEEKE